MFVRVAGWLCAAFIIVSCVSPPAGAAPISITSGDMFTVTTAPAWNRCTITDVGYREGKPVALTAGHCGLTGLRAIKNGREFGTFHRSTDSDTAFIILDPGVQIQSSGRHASTVSVGELVCKNGNGYLNEGERCGIVTGRLGGLVCTTMMLTPGDSGSPVYWGRRLVGVVSSVFTNGCAMAFTEIGSVGAFPQ